jgi:hypothetical protein
MIYVLQVSTFAFITKLNTLTWTFASTFFLKSGYLRATLFGLTEWPFLLLVIPIVTINGSQYLLFRFLTLLILYLLAAIKLIGGWYVVLFTWMIIIKFVNTICGVATTLVVATSIPEVYLRWMHEGVDQFWDYFMDQ